MDKILYSFFLLICMFSLSAQTTFTIPCGTTPNIDGIFEASEWEDADTTIISKSTSQKVTVYMKHDTTNLYFAFTGPMYSTPSYNYPEIILDINNNKSETWDNNDFWFHVSMQDCWGNGDPYVWSTCSPTNANWVGVPNFSSSSTDTVEMKIPYNTVSLTDTIEIDTIGIGFMMFDGQNVYKITPTTSAINNPSSWGNAFITSCSNPPPISTGIHSLSVNELKIYPNPSKNEIYFDGTYEISEISIFDSVGKQVLKSDVKVVNISSLKNGIYIAEVSDKEYKIIRKKFVIQR